MSKVVIQYFFNFVTRKNTKKINSGPTWISNSQTFEGVVLQVTVLGKEVIDPIALSFGIDVGNISGFGGYSATSQNPGSATLTNQIVAEAKK